MMMFPRSISRFATLALIATGSCRNDSQASARPPGTSAAMTAIISAERLARLRRQCPVTRFLVTAVKPRRTLVETLGCAERVAETTYYAYIDPSGEPLVVGRVFPLYPEPAGRGSIVSRQRLERLTDSASALLATRFGASARCASKSDNTRNVGRLQRWDGEDFGVLLSEDYDEYRSRLTVEVHAGEPSCARLAGRPARH